MKPATPVTNAVISTSGSARSEEQKLPLTVEPLPHVRRSGLSNQGTTDLLAAGQCQTERHGRVVRTRREKGMIFVNVRQVTSKVHESLVLHERASGGSDVNHFGVRPVPDLPAGAPSAEAPVDVFVVDEEALVELSDIFKTRTTHQEKAPHDPVDVLLLQRRTGRARPRRFRGSQEASHVEPWTRELEERRLKTPLAVVVQVRYAQRADVRMSVHVLNRFTERILDLNRVVVEEDNISSPRTTDSLVVRSAETAIVGVCDEVDPGESLGELLHRLVVG